MRYGMVQRILSCLGLKKALETGNVHQLPTKKRHLWILIGLVLLSSILLTPSLLVKWTNLKWADFSSLCEDPSSKISANELFLKNLSNYNLASTQASTGLDLLEQVTSYVKSNYQSWPSGCTQADVDAAVNEAKNRQCYKEKCVWLFGIRSEVNCVQVAYPCPTSTTLTEGPWTEYTIWQSSVAARAPVVSEEFTSQVNTQISELVDLLIYRADIASNCYVIYM
jgi:hypothetical protein